MEGFGFEKRETPCWAQENNLLFVNPKYEYALNEAFVDPPN